MSDTERTRGESLLVLRAQMGDRAALDEIFRAISGPLLRYVSAIVQEEGAGEDVLQEVLVIVFRKIRWLRDPARLRPWVYRLAAREAIRFAGRRMKRQEAHLTEEEWSLLGALEETNAIERQLLAESALREIPRLPPASRAILSLHYLEGVELRTAADILGIPVGTAKSRLSFGIERVRERLGVRGKKG